MLRTIGIVAIAFVGILVGSVAYRLQKSKPIMKPEWPQARFSETWRSGRSDRNPIARLAFAKNFLWVSVARNELRVSPHFPFSLMFLPEALGLDHRIPGKSILDVGEAFSHLLGRTVVVKYRHATGDEETLELAVSDAAGLREALTEIRK
ncbi:MAG TPA: hypothetical protein VNM15_05885 [Candidatus Binatia bacterium]|nr:hypothetical protein [Candidatus Binatia bacterium]